VLFVEPSRGVIFLVGVQLQPVGMQPLGEQRVPQPLRHSVGSTYILST
jgi:hypothetical protein